MALHLSGDSLDWALLHIERYGDTNIFPRPFEFAAIRHQWDDVKSWLMGRDLLGWTPRQKRSTLTPKGRFSYRVSTQIDPLDSIIYLGLIYEIGNELEAYRVPPEQRIVFSNRFAPTAEGHLYDRSLSWSSFLAKSAELAEHQSTSHVVVADIADFFPRIYQHRVKNSLDGATRRTEHVRVIMKLLRSWSRGVSYGIPVGPTPSLLIAEVTIDDVDQYLRAEGTRFCRYVDDYRIFCDSYRHAYERLARLAELLHQNHGLTLQAGKTSILTVENFRRAYLRTPESVELRSLAMRFDELVNVLDLDTPYEPIDYQELDPNERDLVDRLNLDTLLGAEISSQSPDLALVRFILRRLGQLNHGRFAPMLLEQAERFYPIIPAIIRYVEALTGLPSDRKRELGNRLASLIQNSYISHLPYHKGWLLSPFTSSGDWLENEDRFQQLYNEATDVFSKRKLILAMGRAHKSFWFRSQRDNVLALDPWERRAFLASASCLGTDERRFWYRSLDRDLDPLEKFIVQWAQANPF